MINAARAKLVTDFVSGGETEVGDGDAEAAVKTENILWFQVPVIDTEGVAVLNCVKQL